MEQVVIAVGVVGLLFVVTSSVAVAVVVRGVRRRYRSARTRFAAVRGRRHDPAGVLRVSGSVAAASLGSPGWWVAQNRRHQMWRAVTSAEHAVKIARRAEVAVGDLPSLVGQLHYAANGVDSVVRAGGRQGSLGDQDRAECDRIIAAAREILSAALASLRIDSHADTESIVSAVQLEVAALSAGLRAAHN